MGSEFASLIHKAPDAIFTTKLLWLSSKLDRTKLRLCYALAWSIWFIGNKYVHEKLSLCVSTTASLQWALSNWWRSFARMPRRSSLRALLVTHSQSLHGKCPLKACLKSMWMLTSRRAIMLVLGAVVRNDRGELVVAAVKRKDGGCEVETAEVAAVRYGMVLSRRFGYRRIWVEGDALNVTKTIDSRTKGFSPE